MGKGNGEGEGSGGWQSGLCDCCSSCENCKNDDYTSNSNVNNMHSIITTNNYNFNMYLGLCGWCCAPCQVCSNARRLGDGCFTHCLLWFFCGPCLPICLQRGSVRQRYSIFIILCNWKSVISWLIFHLTF